MNERNETVTFEIKEHIGVISSYDSGWNKELNIVSWNGGSPKYDIRDWDPDHDRMSKGITLLDKDMRAVVNMYISRNNRNVVGQAKAEMQEREERRKSITRPSYGVEPQKEVKFGAQEDDEVEVRIEVEDGDEVEVRIEVEEEHEPVEDGEPEVRIEIEEVEEPEEGADAD